MEYQGKDNLFIMRNAINYNNHIYNWITKYINPSQRILDFGAGYGEFCNRFDKKVIVAVELDSDLRKLHKCPTYESLDDINEKFDFIYSSNVLEHIENDYEIVTKLIEKLKPNGIIKILVPARMEIYTNMDKNVGHFRRYDFTSINKLFNRIGIEVIECKYFDFLGYFAALAYKTIDNSENLDAKSLKVYDKFIFPASSFFDYFTNKLIGKNIILTARKTNH